jgi:hypothetical protein
MDGIGAPTWYNQPAPTLNQSDDSDPGAPTQLLEQGVAQQIHQIFIVPQSLCNIPAVR